MIVAATVLLLQIGPAEAAPSAPPPSAPTSVADTAAPPNPEETEAPADPPAEPPAESVAADEGQALEAGAPAELVNHSPAAPGTSTAAVGAGGQTPLPAAPPAEDPSTIADRPWRGRFFFDFDLGVVGPIGGSAPARGNVVSAYGGLAFGARVHPIVAVGGGITTFIHDAERRILEDEAGVPFTEQGFGRVTQFDLAIVRVLLPVARRVEPWAEAGAGIGLRRRALLGEASFAASARAGVGVDFWLGPTFTLGLGLGYRVLFIERSVGHVLLGGARFAIHW